MTDHEMDPQQAEWILEHVLNPTFGNQVTQPTYRGQGTCLHLATPVCHGCFLGYHGGCSGWSWPRIPETWITDHHGSHLFWMSGSHYLVWTSPRRCECLCPRQATWRPPPVASPTLSAPKAESRPRTVNYEQPDLFTT